MDAQQVNQTLIRNSYFKVRCDKNSLINIKDITIILQIIYGCTAS